MKILQIHNHYREGGGEDTVVAKEAAVLRSGGHTVVEYRVDNPPEPVRAATSLLVAPWNPSAARRIRESVEQDRPDVAHIHNTWWALSPSIVGSLDRLDIPIVMTLHNYRLMCVNAQLFRNGGPCEDCVGSHPWRGVRHKCYRDSFLASTVSAMTIQMNRWTNTWAAVDRFLSLTEFARRTFIQAGFSEGRFGVKNNFVDDPGPRSTRPSQSKTVLYVGRLSQEKGVDRLLAAWSQAAVSDLELLVVGDGPMRKDLESHAASNVRFTGRLSREEVSVRMLGARALVFPSIWYEGQPMVLLEALAAGLPLVVSDIGGVPETVSHETAGILAQPGDVVSWVGALTKLLDEDWVDKASASARALFSNRFNPKAGLAALLDEYATAIDVRCRR